VNQRQQDTYAPNRSYVAKKVAANFYPIVAVLAVTIGILAAIFSHHTSTVQVGYQHGSNSNRAPIVSLVVAFLLIGIGLGLLYLIARRIRLRIDRVDDELKVINLIRSYRVRAGDIKSVEAGYFPHLLTGRGWEHLPCVTLLTTRRSRRGRVKVLASMSPERGSPLIDALQAFCASHAIPCELAGMVDPSPTAAASPIFEFHGESDAPHAGATPTAAVDDQGKSEAAAD
jgi:hypothetical protein